MIDIVACFGVLGLYKNIGHGAILGQIAHAVRGAMPHIEKSNPVCNGGSLFEIMGHDDEGVVLLHAVEQDIDFLG